MYFFSRVCKFSTSSKLKYFAFFLEFVNPQPQPIRVYKTKKLEKTYFVEIGTMWQHWSAAALVCACWLPDYDLCELSWIHQLDISQPILHLTGCTTYDFRYYAVPPYATIPLPADDKLMRDFSGELVGIS